MLYSLQNTYRILLCVCVPGGGGGGGALIRMGRLFNIFSLKDGAC